MKNIRLALLLIIVNYKLNAQDLTKINSKAKSLPYTILVDFSKHIDSVRLWVFSNKKNKIILSSKCAHGIKSGINYAVSFSNELNTNKSSLGSFLILNSYKGFYGESWALKGLSINNSNASKRSIIIHSSKKMSTKWSWGCFSIPQLFMDKLNMLNLSNCYLIAYN